MFIIEPQRCGHCYHIMNSHFQYFELDKTETPNINPDAATGMINIRHYYWHCLECGANCG